jgi:hypothetical protein
MIRSTLGRSVSGKERRWLKVFRTLNEYQARLFAADKALDLGRGGISRLSALTGLSRTTITKAVEELQSGKPVSPGEGRVRRVGGGRKKVEGVDPGVRDMLEKILEETTAGDPMSQLRWTSKSTRTMAEELTRLGHPVTWVTVARCLDDMGYSLQANRKSKKGPQHADRDAQFRYINRQVKALLQTGDPVISVDAKKKELVGPFKNGGRTWRPKGKPQEVNTKDFPSLAQGKALPYGVYDTGQNRAVVNVGVTHDTAEFEWKASGDGGKWTGEGATQRQGDYSSAQMLGGATEIAFAAGNSTCNRWRIRSGYRSRSVTILREPASGTRSSTGSSRSSV